MKRPSFQFYPNDWTSDLSLRRCSPAARGVWMDLLCALHNSDDEYGILRWPLKEIASTVGASLPLVRELIDKGVLKGSDTAIDAPYVYTPKSGRKEGDPVTLIDTQPGPLWYSKRLVKDEYIRTIRGESTRFGVDEGAAPKVPKKVSPKPPFGDGTTSSSSSSSSTSVEKKEPPASRVPLWQPPAWLPSKQWDAFVAMRKAKGKRAPFTEAARDGIVSALDKLRTAGHDPGAVLQESVNNGWSGVFAPKVQPIRGMPSTASNDIFAGAK